MDIAALYFSSISILVIQFIKPVTIIKEKDYEEFS
jgi:hypothetical protein